MQYRHFRCSVCAREERVRQDRRMLDGLRSQVDTFPALLTMAFRRPCRKLGSCPSKCKQAGRTIGQPASGLTTAFPAYRKHGRALPSTKLLSP